MKSTLSSCLLKKLRLMITGGVMVVGVTNQCREGVDGWGPSRNMGERRRKQSGSVSLRCVRKSTPSMNRAAHLKNSLLLQKESWKQKLQRLIKDCNRSTNNGISNLRNN